MPDQENVLEPMELDPKKHRVYTLGNNIVTDEEGRYNVVIEVEDGNDVLTINSKELKLVIKLGLNKKPPIIG